MENKHTQSVSLIDGHTEEMTDAEIIKALECCSKDNCEECPANGLCDNDDYCFTGDILDLINRQQAEIERLTEERDFYKAPSSLLAKGIKQIKSEAIKEFAERLCEGRVSNDPVVIAVKTELKMTEVKKIENKKDS